ncbi:MAG: carboxypeptidase-like regulatory domain-containing protein [Flavobacteriales bacterium]|nr:carboxypeptidase-like regulatory domain-containing protein [Flavobacteriales bacterium]
MRYALTVAFCFILFFTQVGLAQQTTQTVCGQVRDKDTRAVMPFAAVALYQDSVLIQGVQADPDGLYRMEEVPLGRYTLIVSFIGYQSEVIPGVMVNSGKEVILDVLMEESAVKLAEVVVTATENPGDALNQMSLVSSRAFSVDETGKYAGSRGDPARMASNFAGVQGSDDSSNDIIVRGNSPIGLLWRLEGVNIPNPNHFGVAGTSGGPVSILNNKLLSTSDFMTGAFPAEYGNTVSGVFDLRMRSGNDEKHEFSGQWGFLGTELLAEGPLPGKGRASYLVNYRYSTLAMFRYLGVRIGTDAVPYYQDGSFKLNFPTQKSGDFSLFGIGGLSHIDLVKSTVTDPNQVDIYGDADVDEYYSTGMGVLGANYTKSLGPKTYAKVTLSMSREHQRNSNERFIRHIDNGLFVLDSLYHVLGYNFYQDKYALSVFVNHKLSNQHVLKAGFISDHYCVDMADSTFDESLQKFITRLDYAGGMYLNQGFLQWQWKQSDKVTVTAGMHGQYLTLNNALAIEPRAGIKWKIKPTQSLSAGIGMHSQMMPTYLYFVHEYDAMGRVMMANRNTGFSRSNHYVVAYDNAVRKECRLKVEAYYQQLYKVPVEVNRSSYSILNEGTELNRFFPDSMMNKGRGRNMGVELTLERFFHDHWFGMITTSLYD